MCQSRPAVFAVCGALHRSGDKREQCDWQKEDLFHGVLMASGLLGLLRRIAVKWRGPTGVVDDFSNFSGD
jgi:hypothetical protein